jgi:fluoride ion exporter CrcB/FEX
MHEHKSLQVISAVIPDKDQQEGQSSSLCVATNTIARESQSQSNLDGPSNCSSSTVKSQTMLILYLSSFAIIGSTIRQYLSRIFGLDCSSPPLQNDYVSALATCLTSNGLTAHHDGAIFIDLPANMLGCLLMGLMIPMKQHAHCIPTMPWLNSHHPMQSNHIFHVALQTAFCGSLTTFASWNSQMVIMLLGAGSDEGSSKVVQALMGYLLGIICSLSSFQFGRHLGRMLFHWRGGIIDADATDSSSSTTGAHPNTGDGIVEEDNDGCMPQDIATEEYSNSNGERLGRREVDSACTGILQKMAAFFDIVMHGMYSPFVFVTVLVTLFLVGYYAMHSKFHGQLWVGAIFAPPGTLLRWKLGQFNARWFQNSDRWRHIPFGTLTANVLGCIVSIVSAAALIRLHGESESAAFWIGGIKTGFAGNLSTVSSFVKEIVLLSEKYELGAAYLYAMGSVLICCLVGLLFCAIIIKV